MSNCAFWSTSGELVAVHGAGARSGDPRASFGPWAAGHRLTSGRLVSLSAGFFGVSAPAEGWTLVSPVAPGRRPRTCRTDAPVAVFAPAYDTAADLVLPPQYDHEKFSWRSWPTWVSTCVPDPGEGPGGWFAAVDGDRSAFLVRLVPHQGRLPGDGWRNMLRAVVQATSGLRLVPLNGVPSVEALAAVPSWDYRVEAGPGANAAAWDLQVLPSRRFLADAAPGTADPWEATALLRWIRPGAPEFVPPREPWGWAELLGRLPVADARVLVQNVLTTLPGGAAASAALFFDTLFLPGAGGPSLVRRVPQPGLPFTLVSTLFGARAWREVERAKRFVDPHPQAFRRDQLEDLDRRLAEGRLVWSAAAVNLWERGYREPRRQALRDEVARYRASDRWTRLLEGDPRVAEAVLRALDVTDLALCLRDAPDRRWRRFVTARREAEVQAEQGFCRDWAARGELTVERELDAWRSWDALVATFPLTEPGPGT